MMRLLPVVFVALATLAPVRAVPVDPDCSDMDSATIAAPTMSASASMDAPMMSASATMAGPSSTASGATPSATSSAGGPITLVATTWYTSWHMQYLSPDDFPWDKYTAVGYSFAETTNDPTNITISDSQNFMPFLEAARKHNVDAHLTVGGWSGSKYFSMAVTPENRTMFVNTLVGLVQQYDLDGLDFDWEFPNGAGSGCNVHGPDDAANYLAFLQELRKAAPNITLSAAAGVNPFDGFAANGAAFADVLDYLAIMNYDVYGSWSSVVGANAPIEDCAPEGPQGSARLAVQAYTGAGFPAEKLVLGVAAYGHSFSVDASAAFAVSNTSESASISQPEGARLLASYPTFDNQTVPFGDAWDEVAAKGTDSCGISHEAAPSGVWNYGNMVKQGILKADGSPAAGLGYRWDNCSQTPFLYLPQNNSMISYDDPQSFAAKGRFINEMGLLGFAMWEAAGDHNTDLVDAIINGIGAQSC